jgi:hypothetical protein
MQRYVSNLMGLDDGMDEKMKNNRMWDEKVEDENLEEGGI